MKTESRAEALKSVASAHSDAPQDEKDAGKLATAATTVLIEGAEELPAADESILDEPILWEATHSIGPYTVQERQFVNGLRYWVEETGKRRRPTASNPLRKFAPKPEPVKQLWLDRNAFAIVMAARFSEYSERAEDAINNVAERIDDDHVLLSLYDKVIESHHRYMISIPEEFEVIGSKLP